MQIISLNRPDDWHVHLRDVPVLEHTVMYTAKHFARALVMPNLTEALTSIEQIQAYRSRILAHLPVQADFTPYMTLYLNQDVSIDTIQSIHKHPYILGAKYYPAGATTNSQHGVRSIQTLYSLLEVMQAQNLVLQIHGEVTHGDIFSREARFIQDVLAPILRNFPKLRIVLEHISSQAAVEFVMQAPETLAATITPHHLLFNRNDMLVGGIKPHYYCLPILKQARDQKALQMAAISGNPKFFAGTDSAPHAQSAKENACGCAGIFSAPYAVSIYTQIFDKLQALNKLNAFVSHFGAHFYMLPVNEETIDVMRKSIAVPETLAFGKNVVIPIAAGQTLEWSVHD